VTDVFAPFAGPRDPLIELLVVATDVYTWKLLRVDRGLSRATAERRMRILVDAVLASATTPRKDTL
jgi:predicted acylesterase/phospholipase RssA